MDVSNDPITGHNSAAILVRQTSALCQKGSFDGTGCGRGADIRDRPESPKADDGGVGEHDYWSRSTD